MYLYLPEWAAEGCNWKNIHYISQFSDTKFSDITRFSDIKLSDTTQFSDIKFSDTLRFSDYFEADHFFIT